MGRARRQEMPQRRRCRSLLRPTTDDRADVLADKRCRSCVAVAACGGLRLADSAGHGDGIETPLDLEMLLFELVLQFDVLPMQPVHFGSHLLETIAEF